ncbi:hypothetical protein ACR8AL_01340 [Clavibacter sepedonicus]|uniref:Lipoprotein n=1 Tax=Clavibacter sepedonicus TaxID=31964 RepID=B0RIP7_CLASE|nr:MULTISPECIES: hypothetical protein [Clavibacter]MBD5381670.1 hypothetical protein [Clavibacter sp.]OQJ47237.1 hypothetical protein B5P19_02285 [Clavibacter sepedonicus]OQJ52794.1 hypothetical protein B5P20_00545 [Clavibacter sepedonicus]UUK66788.1 hypothetical protein LRE50_06150 [Clavibacter sepedonicus]CAQ01538.1 putative lipoprotein [Clavibacter sepedonicus]
MIRTGRAARLALAAAAVALLSGCVYDVSDYGLETPDASAPPSAALTPSPTPGAAELGLPAGCTPADLSIDWAEPAAGPVDELLAVRVMTVRIPSAGEQPGLGSTTQRVTRVDTALRPALRLELDKRDGSATPVADSLAPPDTWAAFLAADLRDRDLVGPLFGWPLQITSFDPVLDRAARYVIGYLGSAQSAHVTVTGCDGAFRGSGTLEGLDPTRYAGAVLLECGVPPGDQYDRWDLLEPYCADGQPGTAGQATPAP